MSDLPTTPSTRSASPAERAPEQPDAGQPARSGGSLWIWLLVIAALAGGGWWWYQQRQAQPPAGAAPPAADAQKKGTAKGGGRGGPTPVVAAPVRRGSMDVYLDGLGTVTPLRTVVVRPRVDGQLMRVHYEEGQLVRQGQLLAEIDPRPFQVQLRQAEGQLARDQALLANARLDLERYRTLLGQDSIAKQQVDSQEALVRQYEGVVEADKGQVDNARLQLTYARVTAPIAGRVGLRQIDPGNIVRSGDAAGLVVITQLEPIAVLFTLPQDELPAVMRRVRGGEKLPVEAWDRERKNKLAEGALVAVDNLVDTTTGTIKLKASFDNKDGGLFPNQFVNVRLKLETLQGQIIIPSAAVQRGGRGLFVYVVRENMTVTAREVKLGPTSAGRVVVLSGVRPREQVVIDGIDRLREGARVELAQRPEFKPSVDGTSGARKGKKGKKGKGKKGPEGGAPAGAAAGQPAAAEAQAPGATAPADAGSAAPAGEEAPPKKRRRRDAEGEGQLAPAPAQ